MIQNSSSVTHLLKKAKELEISAHRRAAGLLSGDYATAVRGQGLLFHEARKYVDGEDARRIDWNMTARLNEPYVRVFEEEREREVYLALDVSPSMHTGWQKLTKMEYALEVAATLAVSALRGRDRIGWSIFSQKSIDSAPPEQGRPALFRFLKRALELSAKPDPEVSVSDPRSAIHTIRSLRNRRMIIFIISDFIDRDVPDDLKFLSSRHDVNLIHIYDPLEYAENSPVKISASSAEGGSSPVLYVPGEYGGIENMSQFLRTESARLRMASASFSTSESVEYSLRRYLYSKKKIAG